MYKAFYIAGGGCAFVGVMLIFFTLEYGGAFLWPGLTIFVGVLLASFGRAFDLLSSIRDKIGS